MLTRQTIEALAERVDDALFADGFDAAIIGYVERCGCSAICYDYAKCVKLLMKHDGMDYEAAVEWMEFNVVGAYVGETSPFFFHSVKTL